MIANIEPLRAAVVSILSATFGTINKLCLSAGISTSFLDVDVALQRLAWTVAILAGVVAIVNGVKNWFKRKKEKEPG